MKPCIDVRLQTRRWQKTQASKRRRLRPTVFALEDRTLLSNFMVNSTADDGSAGTLRWAISQANANNQADTIAFSSLFNTPQTIKLTGGYSPLTLDDSATTTISGPGADLLSISGGGATKVFDISGSADLSGLTITGGYGVLGGGLSSAGATALSNCTISGNSAVYSGGGILNADGTMMLTSCTITGNHAARSGGGVYNGFSGTMALINCTISANGAGSRGGGLGDISSYSLTLTNCTVTGNAASDGGGLSNPSGPTSLTNTIVAGQEPGGDIFGSFSDSGGNLIGGDPLLAPLGDYGGPTPTMPLLPGSPAIGKGTSGPGIPTTDQRGFARGASVDIGAFQTQGSASFSVNVATDGLASGLGQLDLRQAINLADVEPDAPISFAPSVFGTTPQTITLTAGELTLTNPGGNVIGGPGAGLLTVSGNNVSRVFYDQGVSADLSGLTITGGNAPVGGGLDNDGGFLSLTGCTITGNVASDGGGLDNDGGTLLLTNCTIMGNTASDDGGGLASSGAATTGLYQCTVTANYCDSDGGVSGAGGGIADLAGGRLTLSVVTISGNNGPESGGGVYIQGTAELFACTVSGNSADAGGGLENKGTTMLAGCTVSGNTATADGLVSLLGGGGLDNNGGLSLVNCTVSGNTTKYRAGGGLSNRGTLSLVNCTVSGNIGNFDAVGYSVGGLFFSQSYGGAPPMLTNTIVVGNSPDDVAAALNPASANNLVGDGALMTGISNGSQGNQVGAPGAPINALLAPLGDYGGSTATMALLPGSPAIGGGQSGPDVLNADQRDQPRSGRVDIGAFESQGFTLTPVAGSTPQAALVGSAFEHPLAVAVTAKNPLEPIDGGQVDFAVLSSAGGASATLSADPVTIAGGRATAAATANATPGQYSVFATSSLSGPIDFVLTNASLVVTTAQDDLAPDGLTSLREAIAYADDLPGTNTITFDPAVFGATPQTITVTAGELMLTDPAGTSIDGPGAGLLTVSGNNASRVFYVKDGSAALTGLTVTGGNAPVGGGLDEDGGGLLNDGGTLSLSDCTITGNLGAGDGGGLATSGAATTILTECTVSGNRAAVGGGVASLDGGQATLNGGTVSANYAGSAGGGLAVLAGGSLTLANATVSANYGRHYGGGVYNHGIASLTGCIVTGNSTTQLGGGLFNALGTLSLTNVTATGNTSGGVGGGLANEQGATTLINCTVTGNIANIGGGLNVDGGMTSLTNTIVAGQKSGGDVFGSINGGGNNLVGGNPLLSPLGDYGGPTPSFALLPGSPAIGAGTIVGAPTTDQRGEPRTGHVDIGAFQSQGFALAPAPGSSPQTTTAGAAFANPLTVTVTAVNPVEPVDGGVLAFAAPATGASAALSAASAVIANSQAGVTATAGTGGGTYTVTASVANFATAANFKLTNIELPSLVVDTVLDEADHADGRTSLREAIAYAASLPGAQTITFDPADFGTTPQSITLSKGALTLNDTATITISGPGAELLTVNGNQASGVFEIEGGSAAISSLTVTGGQADRGGGLVNQGGTLALTGVTIRGNTAFDQGGGLDTQFNGTTTLTDCTISGNSAGLAGGGLADLYNGAATLTDCTVSDNDAPTGGGLAGLSGALTLAACTVSGNSASQQSGGLYVSPGAIVALTDTIVAGNAAGDIRGALATGSANNLVGDGSGLTGISDGSQGNQVGTAETPINPLLAPLGNYGGPTQTMALLPGSPAIGGGTTVVAAATDERGEQRTDPVDIGAFQSQGFKLSPVANSTPQSAVLGAMFAKSLAVTVTANNSIEPVDGGLVSFAAPTTAASATLSASAATIAGGQASITAKANGTAGDCFVAAIAAGASSASFSLTNTQPLGSPGPIPMPAPSPTPDPTTTAHDVVLEFYNLASLRAAIADANNHPGPDTITFVSNTPGIRHRTIRLTGGPVVLTDPATTTIIGPGARLLSISGGHRSRVFDIRGGSLALDWLTITGGRADRDGGILNERGTLALDRVVLRGNRARVGGGLYNNGATTLTDVVIRGNIAPSGSGLFSAPKATLTRRGPSRPASTGPILVDHFNGKGGVPANWKQFAGQPGDVVEKLHNLTITDSTGMSAGITSNVTKTVPFNPVGVKTSIVARINSVNSNGNAFFGLIRLNGQDSPAGYLAAGIDAHGNVFIVASIAPTLNLTPQLIGVVKGYSGQSITLTFTINSRGAEMQGGGFQSGLIPFNDLSNFSPAAAFPKGNARPALGASSQPGQHGGAASFGSIRVSTALGG